MTNYTESAAAAFVRRTSRDSKTSFTVAKRKKIKARKTLKNSKNNSTTHVDPAAGRSSS
jgi:hypothetical protein